MPSPTPRQILETLLPYLKTAGNYARQIQPRIATQPAKAADSDNFFAAALSDADLSVQTFVEVAILAHFPELRFYGEEYAQTYNTKYFRSIELGPQDDYLITLDPIDGTQFYLDGHDNYQIILTVLNQDEFEAVLAISPSQHCYYYSLRGQGTYRGHWHDGMADCQPLQVQPQTSAICLGFALTALVEPLKDRYQVFHTGSAYSKQHQIPNFNGLLSGDLVGAVLERSQFIDGAALAFMAQEMGYWVTTWQGQAPPPLYQCSEMKRPGLVIGATAEVHRDLLAAVQAI